MGIWTFIQDQVLGMQWLSAAIGRGLEALGLDLSGRLGAAYSFSSTMSSKSPSCSAC